VRGEERKILEVMAADELVRMIWSVKRFLR